MTIPTIRKLWAFYKRDVLHDALREAGITSRTHAQVLAQSAFYGGARSMLQVLAYMIEHDETGEALRLIERQGRQIKKLAGLMPPKQRH